MNIIDAIKSKKLFRRQVWNHTNAWFARCIDQETGLYVVGMVAGVYAARRILPQDLVADDWETEERTVTVTRTQFWKIFDEEYGGVMGNEFLAAAMRHIAHKLGLE